MPDVELRQEKLRKMTEKMQRILSPERIERFVEEQLGDRAKIYASELPMETMDDFIRLIYVRLYGSRKRCDIGLKRQKVRIKSVESLISRILRS